MVLTNLLIWWYGDGFREQLSLLKDRLAISSDHFSVSILLRTLFYPYKQISAGEYGKSLKDRAMVVLDKLLSRCIGAIIRLFTIIFAVILLSVTTIFGVVLLLTWLILPLLPVVGLLLTVIGWTPL